MTARMSDSELQALLQKGARNGVRVHGDQKPLAAVDRHSLPLTEEDVKPTKFDKSEESKLLGLCKNWLQLQRYYDLTANNANTIRAKLDANPEPTYGGSNAGLFDYRGWYGHLVNCEKNSLMPDLFIFNENMSECLMVELKTHNKYQAGQKAMISLAWVECRSIEEFIDTLEKWEKRK